MKKQISLVISFLNWNLMKTEPFAWIGLDNFIELWKDDKFWLYLANTGYLMIGIPVSIGGFLSRFHLPGITSTVCSLPSG